MPEFTDKDMQKFMSALANPWTWRGGKEVLQQEDLRVVGYFGEWEAWNLVLFRIAEPSPPPESIEVWDTSFDTLGNEWVGVVQAPSGASAQLNSVQATILGKAVEESF